MAILSRSQKNKINSYILLPLLLRSLAAGYSHDLLCLPLLNCEANFFIRGHQSTVLVIHVAKVATPSHQDSVLYQHTMMQRSEVKIKAMNSRPQFVVLLHGRNDHFGSLLNSFLQNFPGFLGSHLRLHDSLHKIGANVVKVYIQRRSDGLINDDFGYRVRKTILSDGKARAHSAFQEAPPVVQPRGCNYPETGSGQCSARGVGPVLFKAHLRDGIATEEDNGRYGCFGKQRRLVEVPTVGLP